MVGTGVGASQGIFDQRRTGSGKRTQGMLCTYKYITIVPRKRYSSPIHASIHVSVLDKQVYCTVFDKTGTLTVGKPVVVSMRLLKTMALMEFYELVAATEVNNEHPLAKAVVEYASKFRNEENPI